MSQRPRNKHISPKNIVPSSPLNAGVLLVLFVILSAGCNDNVSVKDVISHAPQMCSDFCRAEYECEWGHGEELEDAKQYFQDQCIVDCTFYTQSGALIIERSQKCDDELNNNGNCISPEEVEEPVARVLGHVVQWYFECLWQSDLFQCNDESFGLHIENEAACGRYADCVGLLKSTYFDGITWNSETGVCETANRSVDDTWYYLEVML